MTGLDSNRYSHSYCIHGLQFDDKHIFEILMGIHRYGEPENDGSKKANIM
jgi:hypothetical protein